MSEQLSQDELGMLTESLQEPTESEELVAGVAATRVDLAEIEHIRRGKLPGLEMLAERFTRMHRDSLSRHLGRVSSITASELRVCKFAEFYKTLQIPSNMHLFRLRPLPSQALLVFSNELVHQFVEILFGSGGMPTKHASDLKRELSAIEQRLVAKVAMVSIEDFTESFASIQELDCMYASSESNPLALQSISPSENVAVLPFDVELNDKAFPMSICLPFSLLSPIREKLEKGAAGGLQRQVSGIDARIRNHVGRAKVSVSVEIARGKRLVKEIANLKVGDVLELSTAADESARVYVEGALKYRGTVGEAKGQRVVRIESAVRTEEN